MPLPSCRRAVAIGLCVTLLGCSSWPTPTTITSPQLAATPIRSIDILPLDLEVWTHAGSDRHPDEVRTSAEVRIVGATTDTIRQRGYAVGAVMDWTGSYAAPGDAPSIALEQAELVATLDSLASYGSAVSATTKVPTRYRTSHELPFPYLPVRLGERTGADATLYIGGWGFIGKEPDHAATVALVIIGVVLIVGIIAIAAASSRSNKGGDRSVADGVASAGRGVARVVASAGRVAAKTTLKAGEIAVHHAGDIAQLVDAFGHSSTHLTLVAGGRPEYAEDPKLPREGKPQLYLEMTLVDNRSGVALWHAQQRFPANAARPDQVARAARSLIATLPRSVGTVSVKESYAP
jgi:hypothetical protein